jgi:uncharacterized protein (TIGR02145 family)
MKSSSIKSCPERNLQNISKSATWGHKLGILRYLSIAIYLFCVGIDVDAQMNGSFTDTRDGKSYKWVKIGNQTWMAENLAYKPESGDYNIYENKVDYLLRYGYLYNWETAKKVCPEGWHLPNHKEFNELIAFVGPDPGIKLKAKNGWLMDGNGTDDHGFSALPGGKHSRGKFSEIEYLGFWWSSTEQPVPPHIDRADATILYISCSLDYVETFSQWIQVGLSVRCLKDK